MTAETFDAIVTAPGFCLGIRADDEAVTEVKFLEPRPAQAANKPVAAEAARQLAAWLLDPSMAFTVPLRPVGSDFQHRVWAQISSIPCGQTRSYGDLAQALTTSPRPVGGACGCNPLPVIVPCHRVVAANFRLPRTDQADEDFRGLGGFAHQRGGFLLDVKRWLLRHEQGRG